MINLIDLEEKINSELTTKIKNSEIKHKQLYLLKAMKIQSLDS